MNSTDSDNNNRTNSKKVYTVPILIRYGNITNITKTFGNMGLEDGPTGVPPNHKTG
jgi:hypothetical protein